MHRCVRVQLQVLQVQRLHASSPATMKEARALYGEMTSCLLFPHGRPEPKGLFLSAKGEQSLLLASSPSPPKGLSAAKAVLAAKAFAQPARRAEPRKGARVGSDADEVDGAVVSPSDCADAPELSATGPEAFLGASTPAAEVALGCTLLEMHSP
jgi:hypothetical protein